MALNDIIKKIMNEAEKKVSFMRQVAETEVKKIGDEAKITAEIREKEINVKINSQSLSVIEKSRTLAKMTGRSQTLKEKREIIDQAYSAIEKELNALDAHDYLTLITKMIKYLMKSSDKGNLTVPTNRRKLTEEAVEKAGADYHIKEEADDFEGGFILKSGKVEVNLSFSYLIQKAIRPDTELQVAKILFL